MTTARALSTIPASPASHTRAVTPRRARLLDELDRAIALKARALALAEENAPGMLHMESTERAAADLRAGLEDLRRMRDRVTG